MIWSRIIVHWTSKLCPLKRSNSSGHIEGIQKAEEGQLTRNFLPPGGFEAADEEQFNSAHPQALSMLWSFELKGVIRGSILIETFRRNDKNRWSAILSHLDQTDMSESSEHPDILEASRRDTRMFSAIHYSCSVLGPC